MEIKKAATAMAALSHETRLELYRMLVRRGPQGHSAGVLAQRLGIAAPILSFHAKVLAQAGLVESQDSGRHKIYTASFAAMRQLVDYLSAECCSQADAGCATDCVPAAAVRRRKRA
jgi:DNA-binding transcriptional ArsR family regulator